MNKKNLAICVLSGAFWASAWGGPLATVFTYQGELRDAGAPADGDYDFVFRLFDADNGGAQIGADVPVDDWPVIGGLFTVELDFGASAFAGDARWLEIAVRPGDSLDPHTTLSPRQALTAAPYALFALNGSGGDAHWTLNGSDIYNTNAGYVGIGTSTPASRLHLYGGTDSSLAGGGFLITGDVAGTNISMDNNEIMARNNAAASTLFLNHEGGNVAISAAGAGNVGIGTSSPGYRLHAVGDVAAEGSVYSISPDLQSVAFLGWGSDENGDEMARIRVGGNGVGATNGLEIQSVGDKSLMRILHNGSVGIGADPPQAKLHVAGGDVLTTGSLRSSAPSSEAEVFLGWGSDANGDMARIRIGGNNGGAYNGLDIQRVGNVSIMRITDDGRVGLGDTTPDARLDVPYTGAATGILASGDGNTAVKGVNTDALNGVTTGSLGESYGGAFGSWEDDGSGDFAYGALGWAIPVAGVYAYTNSSAIDAAYLQGNVTVTGTLSKGGGAFKIDHPLDPENKYLYHSFVESPDMKNIYDGNVTTDSNGLAIVTLPEWFEALNRDFRYQLTVIGQFAQAIVSDEIRENRFSIRTDKPNVKVSWQVTGIRQDAFANANRVPVEEDKSAEERGKYLHPQAFGKPRDREINHVDLSALQQKPNQAGTRS